MNGSSTPPLCCSSCRAMTRQPLTRSQRPPMWRGAPFSTISRGKKMSPSPGSTGVEPRYETASPRQAAATPLPASSRVSKSQSSSTTPTAPPDARWSASGSGVAARSVPATARPPNRSAQSSTRAAGPGNCARDLDTRTAALLLQDAFVGALCRWAAADTGLVRATSPTRARSRHAPASPLAPSGSPSRRRLRAADAPAVIPGAVAAGHVLQHPQAGPQMLTRNARDAVDCRYGRRARSTGR